MTLAAANCHYEAGDPDGVIATYRTVLERSPSPEVAATARYRLGENYESAGDEASAAGSYARVLQDYPSSPMFDRALSRRELIEQHAELDWDPLTTYSEGTALIGQGDFEGALGTCDSVLAATPSAALRECTEYRRITLETVTSGDFTAGCEKLRQHIAAYPEGLRTPMAIRTLEQSWGAIADLETRVGDNPDDVGLLRSLGQGYLGARSTRKGIETLERAVAIEPRSADIQYMLGMAYARAGRNEEAQGAFAIYLEEDPQNVNALNMMGYMLLSQGQAEEAIPYFERYAELAPDDANSHDSLGEGLMTAGRLEDSAREYERAIELNPSFSNSHLMLGRVYTQLGKREAATVAYERFLELIDTGPQAAQARAALDTLGVRPR